MPKVVICYRRSDSASSVGRIFDRLATQYGKDSIVIDIEGAPQGLDYRTHIEGALQGANLMLVVVGKDWMRKREGGQALIENENDPIRIQLEAALRMKLVMVPVLIDDARMPKPDDLPASLRNFAYLNAALVDSAGDFNADLGRLIRLIESITMMRADRDFIPPPPIVAKKSGGPKPDPAPSFADAEDASPGRASPDRAPPPRAEGELSLFVSHVNEDRRAALQVVDALERRGVSCWIAPRDVSPGSPFDDEIADAITACRAMLLIFSDRCNDSDYIRREITCAGNARKVIIPFRIENVEPKRGLSVRLADLHWIDAFVGRERAIDELIRTIAPADLQQRSPAVQRKGNRASGPKSWWRILLRALVLIWLLGAALLAVGVGLGLIRLQ